MNSKVQVVQKCYEEFGKGNPQGVAAQLTDDVTWIDPGYPDLPYAGKRNGKEEVMGFFQEMASTIQFTQFEPQQFYQDGDMVIVKGYFTGKGQSTGKAFETEWVMLWEVVDDKVKSYQAFVDTVKIANALK